MQAPEDLTKERLISDLIRLQQRIDELAKIEEEKKRYETELAHTRAMFVGLFEFAPDAILIVDSRSLIVQANQQAERLFGYTREELLGKDSNLLVPERFREKHRENQKTYMANPHIRQMGTGLELYGRRKDGSEFSVDIALGTMQLEDDIVTLAVIRDFTERKRVMEALAKSHARTMEQSAELKAIIDALPAGVLIAQDAECSKIICNPMWLEIIGVTERQNTFEYASCEPPHCEILRKGTPISIEQLPIRVSCSSGQPVEGDLLEIRRADGVIRHFYGNAVPLFDNHGATRGAVSVLLDITELRQAQDKIAGLAAIVESSTDAIISATMDGTIINWNPGAEKIYGYSDKEVIGRSITLLAPPDRPDEIPAILDKIRSGETITAYDTSRMRKDGTPVDVSLMISPVKDSSGKIIAASGIARDITDRKKLEKRLKQYADELEQSNKELDNFASIAAHDLGAPIRAVSGFAGLLQKRYKEKLGADADQYISNIVEGAMRMQNLINDLLAYARTGTRETPLVPVDVNTVIEKTLANLTIEIQESKAVITADPLPTVFADSTQLIQLFQNLVGNAIKYCRTTPHIHISAGQKDEKWLFRVSDNGIGIQPQQFERIFQIFQRLHTSDEYSGTGIGLATCKKIVERLGGHIWVESKPGEGSTFFFTLPVTES